MNRYKHFVSLLLLTTCLLCSSCGILVKNMATKNAAIERGAIPPDFGKQSSTLLVLLHKSKSFNRHLKKRVKKEYNGDYQFVSEEELENDAAFQDKDKYRYLFRHNQFSREYNNPDPMATRAKSIPTTQFMVIDRKEEKTYYCQFTSGMFSKYIQGYMISLERVRQSNL